MGMWESGARAGGGAGWGTLPAVGDMVPGWGRGCAGLGGNLGDDVTSFLYLDIAGGMESRGECWEVAWCTRTLGFGLGPVNGREVPEGVSSSAG